jgi:hypothetical protein
MIKTNTKCFITTCTPEEWGETYAKSYGLKELLFDGKYAKPTYLPEWYVIDLYPAKIEKKGVVYDYRKYVLKDEYKGCLGFKEEIDYDNRFKFEHEIDSFYNYEYQKREVNQEVNDLEIEVIIELENFNLPTIEYKAYGATNMNAYWDGEYNITNKGVRHQLIDKMMFPDILLPERPCKFTSKQMYDITRAYIKDNINNKYATISSDYDFCFEVKKKIKKYTPEEVTYYNIFAKTKKQRNTPHKKIVKYREETIFKMTNSKSKYDGYPIIEEMTAKNETELKEKVDTWLSELIKKINEPLVECPHCNGLGVISEIKEINCNDR